MNFVGKVRKILEPVGGTSASGNNWKKQTVIIQEDKDQYPDSIAIDWFNKDLNFEVGDTIDVQFNCKANEYQGKFYNGISAFNWSILESKPKTPAYQPPVYEQAPPTSQESDDLPF